MAEQTGVSGLARKSKYGKGRKKKSAVIPKACGLFKNASTISRKDSKKHLNRKKLKPLARDGCPNMMRCYWNYGKKMFPAK